MSRQRRTKEEMMGHSEKRDVSGIGHITTPVKDIARMKPLLEGHGVIITPRMSLDGWYTLVLPPGSTSTVINEEKEIAEIRLPDGYVFYSIPPHFSGTREAVCSCP